MLQLFKGKYIDALENIVFVGPHGVGKTHLAIAHGIQACQNGRQVRFFTVGDLIHQLTEAREEADSLKISGEVGQNRGAILDELGMADCNSDEAKLLSQVINARYEKHSTIITTNLEFKDWTTVFCTQQLTFPLLDRLTHRCNIVQVIGESYRFKESVRRKRGKKSA